MVRKAHIARCAIVSAAAVLAACYSDSVDIVRPAGLADTLFTSYVALGNSITAGFQSSGINDSTQNESYAALLATQAFKTRYAYASLRNPGCPPPVASFLTGALVGGASSTSTTCALRDPASIRSSLNNVAVPGALVSDPTNPLAGATGAPSPLSTFILGGRTQVQRATDAAPTFVTAWIGNNDVLGPAISGVLTPTPGVSAGITPVDQFQASYSAMLQGLKAIPSIKGGIMLGVIQVTNAPFFFSARAFRDPTFRAQFGQLAGATAASPIVLDSSCTATTNSLISFAIAAHMRAGDHPRIVACEKGAIPGTLIGDIYVLDSQEQTLLNTTVSAYNQAISQLAQANAFVYVDVNGVLANQRTTNGCVAVTPNLTSATAPFGTCMSLDGIHPNRRGHVLIANALVLQINSSFKKTLPFVQ